MRVYRCTGCACGFVIVSGQKKAGKVSCPLCKAPPENVTEIDPAEAIGGKLVREAVKLWGRLPSGD